MLNVVCKCIYYTYAIVYIMSDYKIVNGKKVRVCKYHCNTQLVWSDDISGFIETETKIAHTKDRCQEVKSNQAPEGHNDISVDLLLRRLSQLGISIDLNKLRLVK
jgi:hypothetical protein